MQRALPDALDLLTISVEAGLGFDAALAQVARNTEGPLAEELARVLQEMQIGLGRSRALRALGERTTLQDIRSFTSAMVQADAFGIPIGQVLRVQSQEIRVKRRQRAEEQAQKVPVKIMIPLVLFILPCLFIAVIGPAVIGTDRGVRRRRCPALTPQDQVALTSRVFCLAAIFALALTRWRSLGHPGRRRGHGRGRDVHLPIAAPDGHRPVGTHRRDAGRGPDHGPHLPDFRGAPSLSRGASPARGSLEHGYGESRWP